MNPKIWKTVSWNVGPQTRRNVFLRGDNDLGGYDQVGRVLGRPVRRGRPVNDRAWTLRQGRAVALDGTPAPVKGLRALASEAPDRLGIATAPTRLEQAYQAGPTTQVPAGRTVAVTKRVRAGSAITEHSCV